MAKPLAFLLIYVKVTEEKAVFDLMYPRPADVTNGLWSEHEIKFNDYMFEDGNVLSEKIGLAEYHLIGTRNQSSISIGLGNMPFNFHTQSDYLEIL